MAGILSLSPPSMVFILYRPHRYLAKLSSVGSISEEETCEKLKGLIQRQVQMCKRNLEVMDSVRRGAQLAIEECQFQFRNRRWNCSTLDSLPVFGKVVTQGEALLFLRKRGVKICAYEGLGLEIPEIPEIEVASLFGGRRAKPTDVGAAINLDSLGEIRDGHFELGV
ncbi:UNVERIFIED_CONTAM: hypothetical protein K2H54_014714 [Gekko kuhli]